MQVVISAETAIDTTKVPYSSIGDSVKNTNECFSYSSDCHACVVAGCVFNATNVAFERCKGFPSKKRIENVFPPTYH